MATTFYHGLNIYWGTGGAGSSAFGASSIITSIDVEKKIDVLEVKNQYGATKAWVGYDAKKEATFEYVASDGNSTLNGTAVITQPAQGDMITISGGESGVNGTTWIVTSVTEKQMNTDVTKITVRAVAYENITA